MSTPTESKLRPGPLLIISTPDALPHRRRSRLALFVMGGFMVASSLLAAACVLSGSVLANERQLAWGWALYPAYSAFSATALWTWLRAARRCAP